MFDFISSGRYWDKPWTLVSGCTRCSPGCERCWALAMEKRFHVGEEGKIVIHPEHLNIPLKRKKPTVWALWNDLFHESIPLDFIVSAFMTMFSADRHIYLVLTKRIKRAAGIIPAIFKEWPEYKTPYIGRAKNVWIGVTVCNQQEADEKIPILLQIPAAVRWLSMEPMLGPINLYKWLSPCGYYCDHDSDGGGHRPDKSKIDWVLLGTESGPGRRPAKLEDMISVVSQCKSARVPVFVKQVEIGGKTSKDPQEWPKDLRVRELPEETG